VNPFRKRSKTGYQEAKKKQNTETGVHTPTYKPLEIGLEGQNRGKYAHQGKSKKERIKTTKQKKFLLD